MAKKKLNIQRNFKTATDWKEIKQDFWALLAAPLWIIPGTLLKVSDWFGWIFAFAITWVTGAIFDIPSVRRAAWGIAATQIFYTKLSKVIQDTFNTPVWRMGTTVSGLRGGLRGYTQTPLQPGTKIQRLPNVTHPIVSRPMNIDSDLRRRRIPDMNMSGMGGYEMSNENLGFAMDDASL